jgi:hypothetical protein
MEVYFFISQVYMYFMSVIREGTSNWNRSPEKLNSAFHSTSGLSTITPVHLYNTHTPKAGRHAYAQRQLHFSDVLSIADGLNICNNGAYKMQHLCVHVYISTLKLKTCNFASPNDVYFKWKSLPEQHSSLTPHSHQHFTLSARPLHSVSHTYSLHSLSSSPSLVHFVNSLLTSARPRVLCTSYTNSNFCTFISPLCAIC